MSPIEAKAFSDALVKKSANKPCPRCDNTQFSILGDATIPLDTRLGEGLHGFFRGSVEAVVVGCNNCGYLMTHSKAALSESNHNKLRGLLG